MKKAFVTSIGEPTTELCVWSLERQGFEVELIQDSSSLAQKLKVIYDKADCDFLRVDADVVVNRKVKLLELSGNAWWVQAQCFDIYKMDIMYGGIQLIGKNCLPALRKHIGQQLLAERPETAMFRLEEFYSPRRCQSVELVCGLHGYRNDTTRAKATKQRREQQSDYDFDLADRLLELN